MVVFKVEKRQVEQELLKEPGCLTSPFTLANQVNQALIRLARNYQIELTCYTNTFDFRIFNSRVSPSTYERSRVVYKLI